MFPFIAPAVVFYLLADVAARSGALTRTSFVIAGVAIASALAPRLVSAPGAIGFRRITALATACALSLVAIVAPRSASLAVQIVSLLAASALGALVLDLAFSIPAPLRSRGNTTLRRVIIPASAVLAACLSIFALLEAPSVGVGATLLPARYVLAPAVYAVLAVLVSVVVRLSRNRVRSAPDAIASNVWALVGLVPASVLGALLVVLVFSGRMDVSGSAARLCTAVFAGAIVFGHVALVDPKRRFRAGSSVRIVIVTGISIALVALLIALVEDGLLEEPFPVWLAVCVSIALFLVLRRLFTPLVAFLFAPYRGRLLDATRIANEGLGRAASMHDIARAVLLPMRRASGSLTADPLLYLLDPPRELHLDAAGEVHAHAQAPPLPITMHMAEHPGMVIVRAAVADVVVRRPELKALAEALEVLDAFCVVPLTHEGHPEGALVVPRGHRHSPPTLEEITGLEQLADRLSGAVAMLSFQLRAEQRHASLTAFRERAEDRIERLERDLHRTKIESHVLRFGGALIPEPWVAYSATMRELEDHIRALVPRDVPILLHVERGTPIEPLIQRIRTSSAWPNGPLVVANCASLTPKDSLTALFGTEPTDDDFDVRPGWLQLACGGTLVLADLPSLPLEAQRALADALSSKQAVLVGGNDTYAVDVRAIATSRVSLELLVETGAFDSRLSELFLPHLVRVPSLRERRDDLPSLVLLAIDRSCRMQGRELVGIDTEALALLLEYDWPSNVGELENVIDAAVARTAGTRITPQDIALPSGRSGEVAVGYDAGTGTFAELEQRILVNAMHRAGGNKSEAARMLGLKRSTFLDKLRRHGLEDSKADWGAAELS